jgi:hypothetical protein
MLTRSQVAKRLGKSIATVRRLEGVHLFPRKDRRGVHWFEEYEVEALARSIRSGLSLPRGLTNVSRSNEPLRPRGKVHDEQIHDLERRVRDLEDTIEELTELLAE